MRYSVKAVPRDSHSLFVHTDIRNDCVCSQFNTTKSRSVMSGFTLDWYVRLFHNELILKSLFGNTVIIAVCASVAATVLGTLAAIGISRMGKHSKAAVMQVTNIPIVNPEIVTGVSLMLLFVFFQARRSNSEVRLCHAYNRTYHVWRTVCGLKRYAEIPTDAAEYL